MSETGIIEIDVDGLPAAVDEDTYNADPEALINSIREARAAASDLTGVFDETPDLDYDTLVEAFGEDDDDAGE